MQQPSCSAVPTKRNPSRARVSIRPLAGLVVAVALATGASLGAASGPSAKAHNPIKVGASTDAGGRLRSNHRAISIPLTVWCDSAATGEIDASIEQRTTHQKVVRNIAISCDPQRQRVVLVFETTKPFRPGKVVFRADVSAGFGEDFGLSRVGPRTVTV